jgi:predicted metal-dependent phosphoesterase TrpH
MLKVELHSHTADDPQDRIPHTSRELIDRAAALGYDALAITLHNRQLDIQPLVSYAADRGVVLIPGIERTIEGRHVLLLNFQSGTEDVNSFDDLRRLKQRSSGLIIAPHPFFPSTASLLGRMNTHADLFDAVECNAMFTSSLNFNRFAERWARRHGKPMVGNGDVHRLHQLGTTYSLVDAERHPASICEAVAAGRVKVVSSPLSWMEAAGIMGSLMMPWYLLPSHLAPSHLAPSHLAPSHLAPSHRRTSPSHLAPGSRVGLT